MLRKILPLMLILAGGAGGVAAGMVLRPMETPPEAEQQPGNETLPEKETQQGDAAPGDGEPNREYVKMNNQFVVPVVTQGRISSLVVLSLSLEVKPGLAERVYEMEPKLRDGLLQVMFDHANSGGFNGAFTEGANLVALRQALRETAVRIFGGDLTDVLIVDIVRQDN
ncbi:MAG: flagellar basal body-associated protein FliL [Cereibacter sphaeroides]|uniref:Flagellar basal body-associated protein FliL n=1 Tax=Cereibacter sphaeroides TaxID=1063 RepID=A0A2W5UI94_CERSP|nr:MAG: flagellar basal body-associated protein FliL [Cereibacter sphaeroides]